MDNEYIINSGKLSDSALRRKNELENDPSSRTDHMKYMEGQEQINSDILQKVLAQMDSFDPDSYTGADVVRALQKNSIGIEDFKALLSPAAEPFLEQMAEKARIETRKHFGNTVYLFTPLYIANYCENYCVYCGFNCYNDIRRMKLTMEQIEHEMKIIADSGMEEILILTGESRSKSDVKYIGEACKLARKYFRMVGIEIYPVNVEDYRYLHECGVDYVTVFQETYDSVRYEQLHLLGHKRVFPYRFEAQERALMGGMRGIACSALLGLSNFRKDALASAAARLLFAEEVPSRRGFALLPETPPDNQQRKNQSPRCRRESTVSDTLCLSTVSAIRRNYRFFAREQAVPRWYRKNCRNEDLRGSFYRNRRPRKQVHG